MSAGGQLLAFCAQIDVPAERVLEAETIRDLHLIADRPAGLFAALQPADFQALLAETGGALSLQIGLPNLPPLLNIDAGRLRLPLDQALKAIARMEADLVLRLNLSLAKGPLLAHWGLNGGERFLLPFLYTAGFWRLLDGGLLTLDKYLFVAPGRPTLVVLEDSALRLNGPLLHVAGIAQARRILAEPAPSSVRLRERLQTYRETARGSLSWSGFTLQNITPAHLLVTNGQRGMDHGRAATPQFADPTPQSDSPSPQPGIADRLVVHALTAVVLYTANRSTAAGEGFEALYAGAENTAVVQLPAAGTAAIDDAALRRWAVWPFAGEGGDRPAILQSVCARELPADSAEENYAALAGRLGHILNEARWHHRVFLAGRIEEHFRELRALDEYVSGVTAEVAAAVDAMTKGFAEALLGALGVIVLTLIAALVEENLSAVIFRAGMIGYALYLILFQGLYRLGGRLHSFRLLQDETEMRLAVYETRLGKARVAPARAQLAARGRQFRVWLAITALLTLLAALFLFFLARRLPLWLAGLP